MLAIALRRLRRLLTVPAEQVRSQGSRRLRQDAAENHHIPKRQHPCSVATGVSSFLEAWREPAPRYRA